MKKKINIPIAIISVIAFTLIYFLFLYPLATKDFTGDINLPDTMQLNSQNLIKGHFHKNFEVSDKNNTTIIKSPKFSETIEFEYKINTNHKRIYGKLLNLEEELNKDSIVQVKIFGDGEIMVYKTEWDLNKSNEIIIDEAIDKIRTLKFQISFESNNVLNLAMSDFFVSADSKI